MKSKTGLTATTLYNLHLDHVIPLLLFHVKVYNCLGCVAGDCAESSSAYHTFLLARLLPCIVLVAPTTLPSNCTNGDVRLSGGSSSSEGYVQVCINNAWGSVCGSNWDSQDGNVVCGQLGLLSQGNASFCILRPLL